MPESPCDILMGCRRGRCPVLVTPKYSQASHANACCGYQKASGHTREYTVIRWQPCDTDFFVIHAQLGNGKVIQFCQASLLLGALKLPREPLGCEHLHSMGRWIVIRSEWKLQGSGVFKIEQSAKICLSRPVPQCHQTPCQSWA